MNQLLDTSLLDKVYAFLNDTNVFFFDAYLHKTHNQVCAVMDRMRDATAWINQHPDAPKEDKASHGLIVFMVYASLIKSGVESLRQAFGLDASIFKANCQDSRRYFGDVLLDEPLRLNDASKLTDDDFFQYFRSLVFAHPYEVRKHRGILLKDEVQYCPLIVEQELRYYSTEPDDYVGVIIYSNINDRDWKTLRVRFSALTSYLKSRYDTLRLVIKRIDDIYQKAQKKWLAVKVDAQLSEIQQLKCMVEQFTERCESHMAYFAQRLIDLLSAPCTANENLRIVYEYRKQVLNAVPMLRRHFENLDRTGFVQIAEDLSSIDVPDGLDVDYHVRKIFEYLGDAGRKDWAYVDIKIVSKVFADKWVQIDWNTMSNEEIKLLVIVACYFERNKICGTDESSISAGD